MYKEFITEIENLLKEGKHWGSENKEQNNTAQARLEAWKVRCFHTIKRLIKLEPFAEMTIQSSCPPEVIIAHLQIALNDLQKLHSQKMREDYKKASIQGKVIPCYHCGNKTYMKNVARFAHRWTDEHELVWEDFDWVLFFCPVCSKVTLEQKYAFSEDWDPETGDYLQNIKTLYPAINSNINMPNEVRKAFEAALKVRCIDGAACLISLRRTLEMLCKDKGATGGNLFKMLQQLAKDGVLPPILDQMAVVLKNIGNMAAHADNQEFSEDLVSSMVEFTETILDYVYVLPAKLSNIQSQFQRKSALEHSKT